MVLPKGLEKMTAHGISLRCRTYFPLKCSTWKNHWISSNKPGRSTIDPVPMEGLEWGFHRWLLMWHHQLLNSWDPLCDPSLLWRCSKGSPIQERSKDHSLSPALKPRKTIASQNRSTMEQTDSMEKKMRKSTAQAKNDKQQWYLLHPTSKISRHQIDSSNCVQLSNESILASLGFESLEPPLGPTSWHTKQSNLLWNTTSSFLVDFWAPCFFPYPPHKMP